MKWLTKLFAAKQTQSPTKPSQELPKNINPKSAEPVYLTQTVIFGMHPYRSADEDSTVYFVDENRGIRKKLTDTQGHILNFPGIIREDFWVKEVAPNYLKPCVGFRSSFEKREDGWIFLWQVQPDGWYWADEDGFGAEKDLEVILYTSVDLNGNFTGPFRIYSLGNTSYFQN